MAYTDPDIPLTSLPFQVIDQPGFVLLKRGLTQIIYKGETALETILLILTETSGKSASFKQITKKFSPFRKDDISGILNDLIEKRFLIPVSDKPLTKTPLDVFFWQFDINAEEAVRNLSQMNIAVSGINFLGHKITERLAAMGIENILWVDDPVLRNPQMFGQNGLIDDNFTGSNIEIVDPGNEKQSEKLLKCKTVIAASGFGGQSLLLNLNKFCIEKNIHFIPVYLQDMMGYLGPFTLPGQTACLECFRSRQNAHMHNANLERLAEDYALKGQSIAAMHPSMTGFLADLTVMEITKLYNGMSGSSWGSCIKVDFMNSEMQPLKVLKIPRCLVCSNIIDFPAINENPLKPL